jgi:hypothetical protein
LADLASAQPNTPLAMQLQYLRFVFGHLDLPSLIAANRVNRNWLGAMSADSRMIVEEVDASPSPLMEVDASPISVVHDPASSAPAPAPIDAQPLSLRPRDRLEEEQPGSPFIAPAEDGSVHLRELSASGVSRTPIGADDPSNRVLPLLPPVVVDISLSNAEESDSDSTDSDDDDMIRFHGEPAPDRQGLAPSFYHSTPQLVGFSSWSPILELVIPARDSWLRYASRSSCLRNAQRLSVKLEERRLRVSGTVEETEGNHMRNGAALEMEKMNSSSYSSDVPILLPLLTQFPFLAALHLQTPLEKQFNADGRKILQHTFLSLSLHLKELTWQVMPSNTLDIMDQEAAALVVGATTDGGDPMSPTRPLISEWSEEERRHAFCQAVLESLPLLSLNTLSLVHFALPSGCSLAPLAGLPRLQYLRLGDLPVASAHIRLVRSLRTLTAD